MPAAAPTKQPEAAKKPVTGRGIDFYVSYYKQPLQGRQKIAIRTGGHSAFGLKDGTAYSKLSTTIDRAIKQAHELGETEIRIHIKSTFAADVDKLT